MGQESLSTISRLCDQYRGWRIVRAPLISASRAPKREEGMHRYVSFDPPKYEMIYDTHEPTLW
jgi:hypothetical protein